MERTKLLTITIIGLLLINLVTLGFLFLNGPKPGGMPHEGRRQPKTIIIEKLHFDAAQQNEYEKLIRWHRGAIDQLDDSIRQTKNKLYSGLSETNINTKTKDSLIALLNAYQKQVEETHFKHFEDIKKLCKPEQQEDFKALTEELSRIFAPRPRRPRHE
ncbi:Spy/CpxP family protein refolding chaperone [Flavobacterium sp.]|jgi:protein CpxP|uniref:Spy/CpxP family protein refolding chaperone n=1 Tax=Flavobacterium sp. TaxID=239 RepID=UPI003784774D